MAAMIHLEYEVFNTFKDMSWYMIHRTPFLKDGLEKTKEAEIILIPAISSSIGKVKKYPREYSFDELIIGSGHKCLNPKLLDSKSLLEFKKREEAKGILVTHFNQEGFVERLTNLKEIFEKNMVEPKGNIIPETVDISKEYIDDTSTRGITIYGYNIWSFSLTVLDKSEWRTIHLAFTNEADAIEAQNRILGEIDDFYLNYKDYVAINLLKGLGSDKN